MDARTSSSHGPLLALVTEGEGASVRDAAVRAALEAEAVALGSGVAVKLPEVYRLLGEVAGARGHGDAFVFYERALEIVERRGLPPWERAETLEGYARLLLGQGRVEEAAAYTAEAGALRRAVSGSDVGGEAEPRGEDGA